MTSSRALLNPHAGALLSGVPGVLVSNWASAILLWLGGFSGFSLVHAFARSSRVGWFVVGAALLTLYPIRILSATIIAFDGRKTWISTGGLFLAWDGAL